MNPRRRIFSHLDQELRSKLAEYILECRSRDRAEKSNPKRWLSQSRTLEEYQQRLGLMDDYLETLIQQKLTAQATVNVLDCGVGLGGAVQDIYKLYGEHIRAWGVALCYRSFPQIKDYHHRVGLFENMIFENKIFDFILSVRGAFCYSLNSFSSLETALNALKSGGIACLEDSRLLLPQSWFKHYLEKIGYHMEVTRYESGEPQAVKISRQTEQPLNLSKFSERYFSLIHQNREIFLQWGFDRLKKDSPLNSLFHELYSEKYYKELF